MKRLLEMLVALSIFLSGSANAIPSLADYELIFHINSVSSDPSNPCTLETETPPYNNFKFGCLSPGEIFIGHFSVDTAILATDGINRTASIYNFYLPFGTQIYSQGPSNRTLCCFFNGLDISVPGDYLAGAPGFVIQNGEVTDLVGTIIGGADTTDIFLPLLEHPFYIDYRQVPNQFRAVDNVEIAEGTFSIFRVPEPATYTLLLAGLGVLGFSSRRKQQII